MTRDDYDAIYYNLAKFREHLIMVLCYGHVESDTNLFVIQNLSHIPYT